MVKYKCIVAYDGSNYDGYQVQNGKKTIQNEIQIALKKLYNKDIKINSSGRTDKGVHALGQVFDYEVEKEIECYKIKKALNTYLPKDIHINEVSKVSLDFHSRGKAKEKEYCYKINIGEYDPLTRNYIYQYNRPLDLKKLKKVSKVFLGTHNFKNFCTNDEEYKTYQRTIKSIHIKKEKDLIIINMVGNGFLRYMVKMIIGSMIAYCEGKIEIENIEFSLDEKCSIRTIYKVASEGLYLVKVTY